MLDSAVIKIIGILTAVATLLHQVITRDRSRAAEIAQCVKKDELHEMTSRVVRIEQRIDEIYKMLANK